MNNKYVEIFRKWNFFYCMVAVLIASYIVLLPQVILTYLFPSLEVGTNWSVEGKSWTEKIFAAVIFAPIIETFLFQYLPHRILLRKLSLNWTWVMLISALLFGLTHWYGIGYIVFSTLIGLVFIAAYVFLYETNKNPFLVVTFAHMLRNTIALLTLYYSVH